MNHHAAASTQHQWALLEHLPVGVLVATASGQKTLYQNPRFVELFGYTAEEFASVGQWWSLACPDPECREWVDGEWRRRMAGDSGPGTQIEPLEVSITAKNGTVKPVRVHVASIDGLHIISFVSLATQAEAELREKTEALDRFFEVSLDLLCIANTEGYLKRLNPVWQDILGYSTDELMARRFIEFVHPEDVDDTLNALSKLSSQSKLSNFVNRYRCKDGSHRWFEWQAVPVGELIYAAARDITARKRVEDELSRQRGQLEEQIKARTHAVKQAYDALWEATERLTLANKASSMGIWDWDLRDGMTTWDERMFEIYGLPKQLPMPQACWETTIYPDDVANVWATISRGIQNHSYQTFEFRIVRPDGAIRWIHSSIGVVLDGQGGVIRVIGTSLDITERKEAEDRLRKSEHLLSVGASLTHMGCWEWGMTQDSFQPSEEFQRIHGVSSPSLSMVELLRLAHPDDQLAVVQALWQASTLGEPYDIEHRITRQDTGEIRFVKTYAEVVFDETGKPAKLYGISQDITERKRIEEALLFLAHCGYSSPDEDFFQSLARYLAETLQVGHACIGRLSGDSLGIETVALYHEGQFQDNTVYALEDTPCGMVLEKTYCCYCDNVRQLFPNAKTLRALAAESYAGITLIGFQDRPIGLIALAGQHPLTNPKLVESLLKLAAIRAAGELERRQAQEDLKRSEAQYRLLTENMLDAVWVLDAETMRFRYLSPSMEKQRGYSLEEMLSQPAWYGHTPDSRARLERLFRRRATAFLSGQGRQPVYYNDEFQAPRKDGSVIWVEANSVCHFNPETGHVEIHGVSRDVSQRKRAEEALRESLAFNRNLIDSMQDGFSVLDKEGRQKDLNPAFCAMTGFSRQELIGGMPPFPYWPEEKLDEIQAALEETLRGNAHDFELVFKRKSGEHFPVIVSPSTLVDTQGNVIGYSATVKDISERKVAEARLRDSERHFRAYFERPLVGMVSMHPDQTWMEINEQFCAMLGYPRDELIRKTWTDLTHPEDIGLETSKLDRLLSGGIDGYTMDKRYLRKDASVAYAHISVSCVRKPDGQVDYLVGLMVDVTEQHMAQEKLRQAAYHDSLTLLPNRLLLMDRLQQAVIKSFRDRRLLAVCYLDLDGFKAINDTQGHAAGDQVLVEVSMRLRSCVRAGDTVARLGGDEFAVLLPQLADAEECRQILERLRMAIEQPYYVGGTRQSGISTSIGATLFPIDNATPETLLRHADHAMYTAKQSGKNRFHFFEGPNSVGESLAPAP